MKVLIPILMATLAVALVCGGIVVGVNNNLVRQEVGITATWRDSQVQYDTFWKKVQETAQVPEHYKNDLKEIMLSTTEARYEGKDPALLLIAEANPALDPSMYVQVQRVIEAGRNDFAQTQRTLVDRQRVYSTLLKEFPGGFIAGTLGFPKEVVGEYRPSEDMDGDGLKTVLDYKTVTSSKTQETFSTGLEEEPLNVFKD